jgi:hypothetical protein
LLVMVAASVGLGWFTAGMKAAQRQQAAVATTVSLSGLVVFDDQPDDLTAAPAVSPLDLGAEPPGNPRHEPLAQPHDRRRRVAGRYGLAAGRQG